MSLKFGNFEGSREALERLSRVFNEDRFPHAILLEGAAETTDALAGILAKAAVCLSPGDKPCGQCSGCVKAEAGSHPDISRLDGNANPRAFPVDAIRKLRLDAFIRPNEAPRKACLLLGVQNMSEISQNALLKILEEPPGSVLFVLTCENASALLPTIRSRVQTYALSASAEASSECGAEADGIARAVISANASELLFATSPLIRDREKIRGILKQLSLIFRDAEVLRSGFESDLSGRPETAQALGEALTRARLLRLWEETQSALRALDLNVNTALLMTAFCANLREAAGK